MENKVCMTGAEVSEFIDNFSLSRFNYVSNREIFKDLKNSLKSQILKFAIEEQKFYQKFDLENLQEFQERFNEINNSNLLLFTARELQRGDLFKQFRPQTTKVIAEALASFLEDQGIDVISGELTDDVINEATDWAVKLLEIERKSKNESKTVRRYRVKSKVEELLKYVRDPKQKVSLGSYKQEFRMSLTKSKKLESNSTFDQEYLVEIDDLVPIERGLTTIDTLSYYPYFGLTDDQKEIAKDLTNPQGKKAWDNFKHHISSLVVNKDLSQETVNTIMDFLSPSAFIKEDRSGVQGILGELQMLFITAVLMGDKPITMIPSGPLRDIRTGHELGADVLLDATIGLQVKNYKGYESKGSYNYHLNNTLTFETLLDRIGETNEMIQLEQYFSIVNYNQVVTKLINKAMGYSDSNLEAYRNYYNNYIFNKSGSVHNMVKAIIAGHLDSFLSLSDSYQLLTGDEEKEYVNAFYIFGGTDIVPVRSIFQLLLRRVEELEKLLLTSDPIMLNNFFIQYQYTGNKWPDDMYSKRISDVMKDLSIKIDLNIYMSDLKLETDKSVDRAVLRL